jgi:starch synthase
MYSLRYGTLPVVRKTGGLADTVHQYDPDSGDGTGFLFEELTPQAIYDTVKQVIDVWHSKGEHIERMRKQAMQQRFSWEKSSRRYVELYQRALQKSRGG